MRTHIDAIGFIIRILSFVFFPGGMRPAHGRKIGKCVAVVAAVIGAFNCLSSPAQSTVYHGSFSGPFGPVDLQLGSVFEIDPASLFGTTVNGTFSFDTADFNLGATNLADPFSLYLGLTGPVLNATAGSNTLSLAPLLNVITLANPGSLQLFGGDQRVMIQIGCGSLCLTDTANLIFQAPSLYSDPLNLASLFDVTVLHAQFVLLGINGKHLPFDVTLTLTADVPVPDTSQTPIFGALPLFATGLGAFGLLGWRRKRKALAT